MPGRPPGHLPRPGATIWPGRALARGEPPLHPAPAGAELPERRPSVRPSAGATRPSSASPASAGAELCPRRRFGEHRLEDAALPPPPPLPPSPLPPGPPARRGLAVSQRGRMRPPASALGRRRAPGDPAFAETPRPGREGWLRSCRAPCQHRHGGSGCGWRRASRRVRAAPGAHGRLWAPPALGSPPGEGVAGRGMGAKGVGSGAGAAQGPVGSGAKFTLRAINKWIPKEPLIAKARRDN